MPAAREERRIRAKEQAGGSQDVKGAAKHGAEIEVGLVTHPVIRTGGVEIHVGAKIAEHERLAEIARAEVGDYKIDLGIAKGHGVQVDGVREAHVEGGREAELLAHADAEDAAMDEGYGVPGSGEIEDGRGAGIVHGVAVHGGEETKAAQMAGRKRDFDARETVLGRRVHHRVGEEALREAGGGGDDRLLIAGDARDDGRGIDAVAIELGGPLGGEGTGFIGDVPTQDGGKRRERELLLFSQGGEEGPGEEVNVSVGDGDLAPGAGHWDDETVDSGMGKWVMPEARASWVRPATLFTLSFFIMVLR